MRLDHDVSRLSTVLVVGGGAAGTLAAIALARRAAPLGVALHLTIADPTEELGRGVAYSARDDRHLLNVPAEGMSAVQEDSGHFLHWLRQQRPDAQRSTFAPRGAYGRYLHDTLRATVQAAPGIRFEHVRDRVVSLAGTAVGVIARTEGGGQWEGQAVVLAPGVQPPETDWAPPALRTSSRFVADPWATGALDQLEEEGSGAVLLVGTGLTAVDVALVVDRPGRDVHAISRRGALPRSHSRRTLAMPPPEVLRLQRETQDRIQAAPPTAAALSAQVFEAVRGSAVRHGDWRWAFDALRPVTQSLWTRLSADERHELLETYAAWWDLHRHRMAPEVAAVVGRMRAAGRLSVSADEVLAVEDRTTSLLVSLASGRRLPVQWVVNCTGPRNLVRPGGDRLLRQLLRDGLASVDALGRGLATDAGRLVGAWGSADAPIWTLGSTRHGELWETTAIPEIRVQADQVARAVLAPRPAARGPRSRAVRDLMGLPLSTSAAAGEAFDRGLDALMRLRSGADDAFAEAVSLDPGFALGHAALALLGHEGGADIHVEDALAKALQAAERPATERERSMVAVVAQRIRDCRGRGADVLLAHLKSHPRDALAVGAAVPTIAFSGVTDVQQESWELVEGLTGALGGHWWHQSLLAFVRQEQGRLDEAGALCEQVLTEQPDSGHAVHALTHVFYETGEHTRGLRWLDGWLATCGRVATHRAHFSWHAALHELSLADAAAVRRRYDAQLAPPGVSAVRCVVDSASLLWRARLADLWPDRLPVDAVLEHAGVDLVSRPQTPFVGLHAAFALAAAQDASGLRRLRAHLARDIGSVQREVLVPLCDALLAMLDGQFDVAVSLLRQLSTRRLERVGGSAAQREIVEDTVLFCLVEAGHMDEARLVLDRRLDRRPSPIDQRRRAALDPVLLPETTGSPG